MLNFFEKRLLMERWPLLLSLVLSRLSPLLLSFAEGEDTGEGGLLLCIVSSPGEFRPLFERQAFSLFSLPSSVRFKSLKLISTLPYVP